MGRDGVGARDGDGAGDGTVGTVEDAWEPGQKKGVRKRAKSVYMYICMDGWIHIHVHTHIHQHEHGERERERESKQDGKVCLLLLLVRARCVYYV